MKPVKQGIDRVPVTFDDESLVADAGLILVATVAARPGSAVQRRSGWWAGSAGPVQAARA